MDGGRRPMLIAFSNANLFVYQPGVVLSAGYYLHFENQKYCCHFRQMKRLYWSVS
jgi:hypothetical protein